MFVCRSVCGSKEGRKVGLGSYQRLGRSTFVVPNKKKHNTIAYSHSVAAVERPSPPSSSAESRIDRVCGEETGVSLLPRGIGRFLNRRLHWNQTGTVAEHPGVRRGGVGQLGGPASMIP